jgi:hypothetical protein
MIQHVEDMSFQKKSPHKFFFSSCHFMMWHEMVIWHDDISNYWHQIVQCTFLNHKIPCLIDIPILRWKCWMKVFYFQIKDEKMPTMKKIQKNEKMACIKFRLGQNLIFFQTLGSIFLKKMENIKPKSRLDPLNFLILGLETSQTCCTF